MILNPLRVNVTDHSLMGVTLQRLKDHLRILDDDEDIIYTQYILAATSYAETWMGRFILSGTLEAIFNSCCKCNRYRLAGRPFESITSIEVLQDGVYVALTTDEYTVTQETWETFVCISDEVEIDCTVENGCQLNPETVKITYTVGVTPDCVPPQITVGLLQMCASMVANKGDCSDKCGQVPCSAQSLMRQFRRYIVRSAGKSNDCCCR